jgi:putative transcriptional regulator
VATHTVTNRIRRHRFDANEMTQQQLADLVGVTRQTIIAIEGAKYSPSLELAFKLAHAFGKPIGEVFSYDAIDISQPPSPLKSIVTQP